jgi:hypothetical protein
LESSNYLELLDYQDDGIAIKVWDEAIKNLTSKEVRAKVMAHRTRILSMLSSSSLQVRMAAWLIAVTLLREGLLSDDVLRPLGSYYIEALKSIGPDDYSKAIFVSVAPELILRGIISRDEVKSASDAIWRLVDRMGADLPQLAHVVEELLRIGALSRKGRPSKVRVLSDDAIIL